MSKYNYKINQLLNNQFFDKIKSLKSYPIDVNNFSNNMMIKTIYRIIVSCLANNHTNSLNNVIIQETSHLKQIHKIDEYPLMYIFFQTIKKTGIIQKHFNPIPDISDFWIFVKWYREQQSLIDMKSILIDIDQIEGDLPTHDFPTHDLPTSDDMAICKELAQLLFNTSHPRSILHDVLYKNTFIGLDVQHEIESTSSQYIKYLINGNDQLDLFLPTDYQFTELNEICEIFAIMKTIAKQYTDNPPDIKMTIVYSKQKKYFPDKKEVFCGDNVNSGLSLPGNYVYCWRKEELIKVVIHELIHFFRFDQSLHHMDSSKIIIGNIDGIDRINESYTETLTMIILCMYQSIRQNKELNETEIMMGIIDKLKNEIMFSMFQTAKIISIAGGGNWSDFVDKKITIEQVTSVRSYYIIKMILLSNISQFIKLFESNLLVDNNSGEKFHKLVNDSFDLFNKSKYFVETIDELANSLVNDLADLPTIRDTIENTQHEGTWVYRTGRMSCNS